jgi:hypothetical protein
MRIDALGTELTYCTNVHAGESWDEVRRALGTHVAEVKARVCPDRPFGVGLRLGARAADELDQPGRLEQARAELEASGMYVFTLNGFPYGAFHATRVKEQVYRPDWLEPERVRYTRTLARLLSELLPEGTTGSISTVPLCGAERAAGGEARALMGEHLLVAAARLVEIERTSGRKFLV